MKNLLLNALAISLITSYYTLITCGTALAQVPQGIPYQAIARNANGVAIANTAVKVRFSIRDSIATGPVRYQETHNPTTSALGLFSVNVGMGTVVSGSFSGINWGKNAKFLQVELDPAGGTSYTDLGTTQMMSVPYALYAGVAENSTQPNSSYTPSADSVLAFAGVAKLPEGSYVVPNNEIWKIVTITVPTSITPTTIKLYKTGCTQNSTNVNCNYGQYLGTAEVTIVGIGSIKYSESFLTNISNPITAPTCSQCAEFITIPINSGNTNYRDYRLPLWASGGEVVYVGPGFLVFVEKYK